MNFFLAYPVTLDCSDKASCYIYLVVSAPSCVVLFNGGSMSGLAFLIGVPNL